MDLSGNLDSSRSNKGSDSSNHSLNSSSGAPRSAKKSGFKRPSRDLLNLRTPSKTPLKSPGRFNGTPGRTTPGGGDRFIPNRQAMDYDAAYHKIVKANLSETEEGFVTPSKKEYRKLLQDSMNVDLEGTRILSFSNSAPKRSTGLLSNQKAVYTSSPGSLSEKRQIPQMPERVLDAPDLKDDFYLNLLDWSKNNHLAVGLQNSVYLWNATSGDIQQLMEHEGSGFTYISSVKWMEDGTHLAVGISDGQVELWDVEKLRRVRTMACHPSRVPCLSWNNYIVSSGGARGAIVHSDVRVADHNVGESKHHTREVCGLTWSPDGRQLASGCNGNTVCIWTAQGGHCFASNQPSIVFNEHEAAVKALAWCPFKNGILASGGGSSDRTIKIWNSMNGKILHNVKANSQICSMVWNERYRELACGQGYPNCLVSLWKYPSMTKVGELVGHTQRVLQLCLSPDNITLLSAAADETIRLWTCFPKVANKNKTSGRTPVSSLRLSIR